MTKGLKQALVAQSTGHTEMSVVSGALGMSALLGSLFTLGLGLFTMLCSLMGAISSFNSLRLVVFAPDFHPARKGRITARGVVRATDAAQVQKPPLSHTHCLAYSFSIIESRGRRTKAYLHTERRGQWNLTVQTDKGSIAVERCELDLNRVHFRDMQHPFKAFEQARSHELLDEHNISPKNLAGMRRSLIVTESILRDGDQVSLMGRQYWNNQQRSLKNAIMTDKPIRDFILRASVMFVASLLFLYFSIGVIQVAFR